MARHRRAPAGHAGSRHRSAERGPRGIAAGPLVALIAVVLLGLGWFGWNALGSALDRRAALEASRCVEGAAVLTVAVAPAAEQVVRAAAEDWNAGQPVVADHCFHAEVRAVPPEAVLAGLTGQWDEAQWGPRPVAWIPDDLTWIDQLTTQAPGLLGSLPADVPVPTPMPFVAITNGAGSNAPVQAAQEFRGYLKRGAGPAQSP